MEVKINKIQLFLYSPVILIENKAKTATKINEISGEIFNGDILMIPLPEDAPSEIPRMLLKSKDEHFNLQISKDKVAFIYQYISDKEEAIFPKKGLYEKFIKFAKYFNEHLNVQFRRSAMVTNWTVDLDKDGAGLLRENYIKDNIKINSPNRIEIRWLNKKKVKNFAMNRWVFISAGNEVEHPEKNSSISFRIDINTDANKKYDFSKESLINVFLEECSNITIEIIKNHTEEI